jgi:hypothetical protein
VSSLLAANSAMTPNRIRRIRFVERSRRFSNERERPVP